MSFGKRGVAPSVAAPGGNRGKTARAAPTERSDPPQSATYATGDVARWARMPAAFIDAMASFALPFALAAYLDAKAGFDWTGGAVILNAFLFSMAYHTVLEASGWQATLGKKAMGLIVTDADGARIGLGRSLARNTIGRVLGVVAPFYLGYSSVLFTQTARSIHDFVGGTRVRSAQNRADSVAAAFA